MVEYLAIGRSTIPKGRGYQVFAGLCSTDKLDISEHLFLRRGGVSLMPKEVAAGRDYGHVIIEDDGRYFVGENGMLVMVLGRLIKHFEAGEKTLDSIFVCGDLDQRVIEEAKKFAKNPIIPLNASPYAADCFPLANAAEHLANSILEYGDPSSLLSPPNIDDYRGPLARLNINPKPITDLTRRSIRPNAGCKGFVNKPQRRSFARLSR